MARPWDAARSLVWPSAPPGGAQVLAKGTVAVLAAEGFGGQGGGRSCWPALLKRQLLGAKEEPEVTAMEVQKLMENGNQKMERLKWRCLSRCCRWAKCHRLEGDKR